MMTIAVAVAVAVSAQEAPPPAQPTPTAEQLNAVGPAPADASQPQGQDISFQQWIERLRKPLIVPKSAIVPLGDGYAYPQKEVPWRMKIIKEEGDKVWLQFEPPENPNSPLHPMWLKRQAEEAKALVEQERMPHDHMVDFYADIVPPPSLDALKFSLVDTGLPKVGLWQVGLAVADLNGDGVLDLVVPPQRKTGGKPWIFLGARDGHFSPWKEVKWPRDLMFDYGDVAVADFDRDGHLDLAFAIHLKSQYVCYGNGEGDFTRYQRLPVRDPRLFSRAVAVGDFNQDGWPDLVFQAEVGLDLATTQPLGVPTTWVVENQQGHGWKVRDEHFPPKVIADRVAVADIDGDGHPDVVASSSALGWRMPVYYNRISGDTWKWIGVRVDEVLSQAYHFDVEPFQPGTKNHPGSVVAAFEEFASVAPLGGGKAEQESRTGLVWYTYAPERGYKSRALVLSDVHDPYWRVAVGDFDGDGLRDVAAARKSGELEVFLQQPDGSFDRERSPELAAAPVGVPFALVARDFDGDGRDDLLVMGAGSDKAPGGFRLWRSAPATGQ